MSVAFKFRPLSRKANPTLLWPPVKQNLRFPPRENSIPISRNQPTWVFLLSILRRSSTPVMLLLLLGGLPIYGWGVYMQQSWGKTYENLNVLKRKEQTYITRNEHNKYQLTQRAEQHPQGLVRQSPANTIFLQPAPDTSTQLPRAQLPESPTFKVSPIGY